MSSKLVNIKKGSRVNPSNFFNNRRIKTVNKLI